MLESFNRIANFGAKKSFFLFLFFATLSLFFYYNTSEAGLVFDFNGWANVYNQHAFIDAFTSFGYPGLHQLEQIVFYSLYTLFGFNGFAWYVCFALLHALSAVVAFHFGRELLAFLKVDFNQNIIALLASLIFFTSPFAVDVVVSKVTVHYFMSALFIYSCLLFLLKYLHAPKRAYLIVSIVCFTLGLFSLELSYFIPIAVLFILLYKAFIQKESAFQFKLLLSYLGVMLAFLLLHKFVVGSFIGHYGAEVHTKFVIGELLANFFYYLNNYLFFFDFWDYQYKLFLSGAILNYWWVFIIILIPLVVLLVKKEWYKYQLISTSSFLLILFGIGLLPILNLYCVHLQTIESDRYSYVASLFIYILLIYLFFQMRGYLRYGFFLLFIGLQLFFMNKNIASFAEMGQMSASLLDDFRWGDMDRIIILVQPENNNGARAFTTVKEHGSEFAESLYLEKGIDIRDKVELIYEMNVNSTQDSIKLTVVDNTHIHVEVGWWGTWFWKYHNGATPFENERLSTQVGDGTSFDVYLKQPLQSNEVMIYMHGLNWREVNFSN